MAKTPTQLRPVDPSITENFVLKLDPLIEGSWAELYCAQLADASEFFVLLLVGEPKRRKIKSDSASQLKGMTKAIEESLSPAKLTLLVTSPEASDKLKKEEPEQAALAKSLEAPRFRSKNW